MLCVRSLLGVLLSLTSPPDIDTAPVITAAQSLLTHTAQVLLKNNECDLGFYYGDSVMALQAIASREWISLIAVLHVRSCLRRLPQ